MEKWYHRFADVPGVGYHGDPTVNRARLQGHDTVSEISYYEYEGKRRVSIMWPTTNASISASPAKSWKTKPRRGESPAETALRQLRESLELPGTLSDYHFAIQHCQEELRGFKVRTLISLCSSFAIQRLNCEETRGQAHQFPWVLEEVEKLCWLDIRLIERYPEAILLGTFEGKRTYYSVRAFYQLIDMYETEGYLREALEVARIAVRFDQWQNKVPELEARLSLIEAEHDCAESGTS